MLGRMLLRNMPSMPSVLTTLEVTTLEEARNLHERAHSEVSKCPPARTFELRSDREISRSRVEEQRTLSNRKEALEKENVSPVF